MALAVDQGAGLAELETGWSAEMTDDGVMFSERALERVLRHRSALMARNPLGAAFDQPLRAALTYLMSGNPCQPNAHTASGLRYLRDRISVPRDMPLQSARLLRKALEATAVLDGDGQPDPPPFEHRFDQDPRPFLNP
jgi:glutathione S-transferase